MLASTPTAAAAAAAVQSPPPPPPSLSELILEYYSLRNQKLSPPSAAAPELKPVNMIH